MSAMLQVSMFNLGVKLVELPEGAGFSLAEYHWHT